MQMIILKYTFMNIEKKIHFVSKVKSFAPTARVPQSTTSNFHRRQLCNVLRNISHVINLAAISTTVRIQFNFSNDTTQKGIKNLLVFQTLVFACITYNVLVYQVKYLWFLIKLQYHMDNFSRVWHMSSLSLYLIKLIRINKPQ